MSDIVQFQQERIKHIREMGRREDLQLQAYSFIQNTQPYKYSYNFDWLGLPIIQFPQDIIALQEIIWKTQPDFIIETGIARGGSLIFSASILHLLNGSGKVIGIDVDIRSHNKIAIENHQLAERIIMLEGSSTDSHIISKIAEHTKSSQRVMVILDSNHTYEHVSKELTLYSEFVKNDFYLVVMDTVIENMHRDTFVDRPWGKGNNPKKAVHDFLKKNNRFVIDYSIQNKLLITVAPDGYLKCVRN